MIKVKNINVNFNGSIFDYELENGLLLHSSNWNTELYSEALDSKTGKIIKNEYKPIYKYEEENIDISILEENSEEWNNALEIIGFEEK